MRATPFRGTLWLMLVGFACWAGGTYWFVKDYGELSDDERKLVGTWSIQRNKPNDLRSATCEFHEDRTFRFTYVSVGKRTTTDRTTGYWGLSGPILILRHDGGLRGPTTERIAILGIDANQFVIARTGGGRTVYSRGTPSE